jgi:hypothetical protein
MKPPPITRRLFKLAKEFITADIFREVQLATAVDDTRNPRRKEKIRAAGITIDGAGNFLCALGLLCYTDFAARLKQKASKKRGNGETAFKAFFKTLGPEYEAFQEHHNVYDWVRGGMVHNYYMKKSFGVSMRGPQSCGVSVQDDGRYLFVVERYAVDLLAALDELEGELFPPSVP